MAEIKTNTHDQDRRPELEGLGDVVDIRSAIRGSVEGAIDPLYYEEQEWLEEAGDLGGGSLVGQGRHEVAESVRAALQRPASNNQAWAMEKIAMDRNRHSRVDTGWVSSAVEQDRRRHENTVLAHPQLLKQIRDEVAKATKTQLIDIAYNPRHDRFHQEAAREELRFRRNEAT